MYRFRKLGLIHYNDGMQVKAHFLNIVVHDYNIFVKSIFRTRLRLPTVQLVARMFCPSGSGSSERDQSIRSARRPAHGLDTR